MAYFIGNTLFFLCYLVAFAGLGANLPGDAICPSCSVDTGKQLSGAGIYVSHFDKGQTPPVNAFRSLTMHDKDGFFVVNSINPLHHWRPVQYEI